MNLINLRSIIKPKHKACTKLLLSLIIIVFCSITNAQNTKPDTLAPPSLGEQTKGTPAVPEITAEETDNATQNSPQTTQTEFVSGLGLTTVTEHKRESGQTYLIELENSLGGKQYLYENDSDGQIGSSIEDNESIKDIPKWKLGSW